MIRDLRTLARLLCGLAALHLWERATGAHDKPSRVVPDDDGINWGRSPHSREVMCRSCGQPTMHMGSHCYGCVQADEGFV